MPPTRKSKKIADGAVAATTPGHILDLAAPNLAGKPKKKKKKKRKREETADGNTTATKKRKVSKQDLMKKGSQKKELFQRGPTGDIIAAGFVTNDPKKKKKKKKDKSGRKDGVSPKPDGKKGKKFDGKKGKTFDGKKGKTFSKRKREPFVPKDAEGNVLEGKKLKTFNKQKRKAGKQHGDAVIQMNKLLWGTKIRKLPKAERESKMQKCCELMNGKVCIIAVRPDATRCLQQVCKHGTPKHRDLLFQEVKQQLVELCKDKNASQLILRLIKTGSDELRAKLIKIVLPFANQLASNRYALIVLDTLLTTLTPDQRRLVIQQFYSKEFASLPMTDEKGVAMGLEAILDARPHQEDTIIGNILTFLQNMLGKEMTSFGIFQALLKEYLSVAEEAQYSSMVTLVAPEALKIQMTKDGVEAILKALEYSTAKQRKKIIQSFTGQVTEMAKDEHSYLVICRCLQVVDDTVILNKVIVSELVANLADVVADPKARRVLLHLLAPGDKRYIHPDITEKYLPTPIVESEAKEGQRPNCRKSADTRRAQLLAKLLTPLLELCKENTVAYLYDKDLKNVYTLAVEAAYKLQPVPELAEQVTDRVIELCCSTYDAQEPLMDNPWAHRAVKRMVSSCPIGKKFLKALKASQGGLSGFIKMKGVWVFVALMELPDDAPNAGSIKKLLKKVFGPQLEELRKSGSGGRVLAKKLEGGE